MPEIGFVDALAHLLTDGQMRRAFCTDRETVLERLAVRTEDRDALRVLDCADLEAQAQTLLVKRMHEAAALCPRTWRRLESEARPLFLSYAEREWSADLARPIADAARFCRTLRSAQDSRLNRAELQRLELLASEKRWSMRVVQIATETGRETPALSVLFRGRSGLRGIAMHFGL